MAISPKTPSLRLQKLREIASGKVGWYNSPRIDGHKVDRATAGAIVAVYDAPLRRTASATCRWTSASWPPSHGRT